MIVELIDDIRDEFTVESIVRPLRQSAAPLGVCSYDAYKNRKPSTQAICDAEHLTVCNGNYHANYSCCGVRTIWHSLNRNRPERFGPVARCTVERLVRRFGIGRISRKRKKESTRSVDADQGPADLVDRDFRSLAANQLWAVDIICVTCVPTRAGWVYTAFVVDACTREIVGW